MTNRLIKMGIRSIEQLKSFFKRGMVPTQEQFGDVMDSFVHKDETKIPVAQVEGLADRLNKKAGTGAIEDLTRRVADVEENVNATDRDAREGLRRTEVLEVFCGETVNLNSYPFMLEAGADMAAVVQALNRLANGHSYRKLEKGDVIRFAGTDGVEFRRYVAITSSGGYQDFDFEAFSVTDDMKALRGGAKENSAEIEALKTGKQDRLSAGNRISLAGSVVSVDSTDWDEWDGQFHIRDIYIGTDGRVVGNALYACSGYMPLNRDYPVVLECRTAMTPGVQPVALFDSAGGFVPCACRFDVAKGGWIVDSFPKEAMFFVVSAPAGGNASYRNSPTREGVLDGMSRLVMGLCSGCSTAAAALCVADGDANAQTDKTGGED